MNIERVRVHRLWLMVLYLMAARGFLYMAVDDRLSVAASSLAAACCAVAISAAAVHAVAWTIGKALFYLGKSRRTA